MINMEFRTGSRYQTGTRQGQGGSTQSPKGKAGSWWQTHGGVFIFLYMSVQILYTCVCTYLFHCMYEIILKIGLVETYKEKGYTARFR